MKIILLQNNIHMSEVHCRSAVRFGQALPGFLITEWKFEQIDFVVGNRGSVVESDFYTKLKKLDIQEGNKDKLFANHVTQVCEAHNRVIVSLLQQVQRGTRPTTEGSRENIGHNVHV